MSDNTLIPPGAVGGDTIRDIDRSGTKTQVVVLDAGGQSSESLVSASNPMPVLITNASVADRMKIALLLQQTMLLAAQPANGFVPMEIPTFLGAL